MQSLIVEWFVHLFIFFDNQFCNMMMLWIIAYDTIKKLSLAVLRYYTIFKNVSLQNIQPLIANYFGRQLLEAKSYAKRLLDILHRSTIHAKIVAGGFKCNSAYFGSSRDPCLDPYKYS